MKRKYTNKYHFRKWVVKTILTVDSIIDVVVETFKFFAEIVFPAFLAGAACGVTAIVLLKITRVIL